MNSADFPNDENGAVLLSMLKNGDTLEKPRNTHFHFLFPTRSQAIGFAELVLSEALKVELCWYSERESWECTVTKYMVPNHGDITALENKLVAFAQPLEGVPDGWGCFEVT